MKFEEIERVRVRCKCDSCNVKKEVVEFHSLEDLKRVYKLVDGQRTPKALVKFTCLNCGSISYSNLLY